MKQSQHYSIQKQILDIRHGADRNAFATQTEISARYRNEVLPLLENICRELCPGDRLVKIDTLTLTLPPMTGQRYKTTWAEEAAKAFRKSLSQALAEAGETQNQNVTILNQTHADLQCLSTFLHTGSLPWAYTEDANRSLESLFRELITKETAAVRQLLTKGLTQKAFAERLCYQFPPKLLTELSALLQPSHAKDIRDIYRGLRYSFKKAHGVNTPYHAMFPVYYHSLRQLAIHPYPGKEQFVASLLQQVSTTRNMPYPTLLNSLLQALKPNAVHYRITAFLHILETLYGTAATPPEKQQTTVRQNENPESPKQSNPANPANPQQQQEEKAAVQFQNALRQLLREAEQLANRYGAAQETAAFKQRLKTRINRIQRHALSLTKACESLSATIAKLPEQSGADHEITTRFNTALNQVFRHFPQQEKNEWGIPAETEIPLANTQALAMGAYIQQALQQLLREAEQLVNRYGATQETAAFKQRLKTRIHHIQHHALDLTKAYKSLSAEIVQFSEQSGADDNAAAGFNTALNNMLKHFPQQGKNGWDVPAETPEQPKTPPEDIHPLPEALYLKNAGLVLVWPFFTQLFKELELTEDQQFTDKARQYRAIHLLQYLVREEVQAKEYLLGLNKLLCGLAPDEPIPRQLTLLQEEKEAAEALIKAVTGHWAVLKNTSVKGFRETFLIRDGKLSRRGNGWLLQVAQEPYDVLMNKLPWAISLVKLPWMPEALFVEW